MNNITLELHHILQQLPQLTHIQPKQLLVVGCSTSAVQGDLIGTNGSPDIAVQLLEPLREFVAQHDLFLAVQGCEHINRAVVVEREYFAQHHELTEVSVVPHPKAGGSLCAAAYHAMHQPVMVEQVAADLGLDLGLVMIGMQMKAVAVPLKIQNPMVGQARVVACCRRPKLVGGSRAQYA